MKPAFLKDDGLLADIESHRTASGFRLWWLGQSGFLLSWQGERLLFDPYLSDSLTRKYQNTDKPHVRVTERVIDPARLTGISVITSSHNHTDHLDAETLHALRGANPQARVVVPAANVKFAAERLQCDSSALDPIDDGQSISIGAFRIHAVPAAHETLDRDEHGRCLYLGYVVEFGPHCVYQPGDTVRYPGMAERLKPFAIEVAMLPINGSLPERRVAGNLWGREAAQLARDAGIACVIPCHYDLFEFNTVTPDEFIDTCERLGQPYRILRNGEGTTFAEGSVTP